MKSFVAIAFGLTSAVFLQVACLALEQSADRGSSDNYTGVGATSGSGSGGNDAGIDASFGTGGGPTSLNYASLCGEGCSPKTGQPGVCTLPQGGAGGAGMGTGGAGGAGTGGAGSGGDGTGGGTGPGEQCVLVADQDGVQGVCAMTGMSPDSGPCLATSDCSPGLGCVVPGVCRPYCCGNLEACPTQSFCEPAPVTSADVPDGVSVAPLIPVCVPATMCELLDDSSCPADKTCTIVRADGTTSCVTPGPGELDDPCPCAAGHVCSTASNTCFKLCRLDGDDCPANHLCQGGSASYPPNFGVCVEN